MRLAVRVWRKDDGALAIWKRFSRSEQGRLRARKFNDAAVALSDVKAQQPLSQAGI